MTTLDIQSELARMQQLTTRELRDLYEATYEHACRANNRRWLIKRIAWRMQTNAEGDLSERAHRRAMEIANDADLRLDAPRSRQPVKSTVTEPPTPSRDPRLPATGTVLIRKYKRVEHAVTVHATDFEWNGERYTSLSAVAKAITGTHTNGYLFFKLNAKENKR